LVLSKKKVIFVIQLKAECRKLIADRWALPSKALTAQSLLPKS